MSRQLRPSTTMPNDVWYLVVRYLLPEEIRRLYGVNRALFHLAMEERYRSVCFCNNDKRMKWLCKNIKAPLVGQYVRKIDIRPWQIERRVIAQQPQGFFGSLGQTLRHLMSWGDEQSRGSAEEAYVRRKLSKAVKRITNAVQNLPNVQEYKIQCLQGECDAFFVHGLIPTLKNWELTLTKLTLCVPPGELISLPAVRLLRLESLELLFLSGTTEPREFRFMVLDPLVVFVNNLYPALRSLSITATRYAENVDLTPLFKGLGTFSHLRNFQLSMPYDGSSFSCIDPLLLFLARHKNIQCFRFSTLPTAQREVPSPVELKEWIPNILKSLDDSFGDIDEINVALRPLKANSTFASLGEFLSIHGANLASLSLTEDTTLSFKEVQEMLKPRNSYGFAHLRRLSLRVKYLSAELFSFLAQTFPNLQELEIGFAEFSQGLDFDAFRAELMEHWQDFLGWELKVITFPLGTRRTLDWTEDEMGYLLMHSISSLENVYIQPNH